jgi:opacity protein-like surface antigen
LKSIRIILLTLLALSLGSAARAQVFGQYTDAETLPVNGRLFGAYLQTSDNVLGLLTQLRLSFFPGVDFGFRGGLARQNYLDGDRTTVRIGGDLKYNIVHQSETAPVSLAVGGDLSVETGDSYSILTVGPTLIASRVFGESGGSGFTPYGSLGLAFASVDINTTSDTDVAIPLRLGSTYRLRPTLQIVAEVQFQVFDSFGDDIGFAGGVNLPF